jgi:predicted transcriptional regulator
MIVALSALTGFVASVIVHLCTTRVWPRQNRVFSFVICGFVVGMILLLILLKARSRPEALAAALIYAFACDLYIFLLALVITSISVAILVWLNEDGRLPESQMEGAQDDDDFVGGRINRMVESGIFQKKDEQLSLTAKGRILLGAYKGLRSFFGHDASDRSNPASNNRN